MRLKIVLIMTVLSALIISGCSKKFKFQRDDLAAPSVWPYHRGNLSGLGAVEQSDFKGNLDILWKESSNDKPGGPLTIYHDRLVYPGSRKKIKFYDINSGKFKGIYKSKGEPQTGLTMKDSLGFFAVGPKKGKLKCVNLLSRKTIWDMEVKDAVYGSIIVLNKLIIGSSEGTLYALEPSSGELLWKYNCDSRITAPPTSSEGKIYLTGDAGRLYILDAENGDELNRIELNNMPVSSAAVNSAVFVCDVSGRLYSIDSDNGSINWQVDLNSPLWTSPAVDDNRVYLAGSSGDVYAFDKKSGVILWKYEAVDVIRSSVLVVGDYVVFGTMSGNLFCLDASDGTLRSQAEVKGGIEQAPISDGSRIFVASEQGKITCFGDDTNEKQLD